MTVAKHLTRSHLESERLIFPYTWRDVVHHCEEVKQQSYKVAGHIASTVEKQRAAKADAQLVFFFLQPWTPLHEMVPLTITVGLPTSLNLENSS